MNLRELTWPIRRSAEGMPRPVAASLKLVVLFVVRDGVNPWGSGGVMRPAR